jgi:hypothetical protein
MFARKRKGVEGGEADVLRGAWVFATEGRDSLGGVEVVVRLPAVVTYIVPSPFHQVLHAAVSHPAVQDRLYVVFRFAIDKNWIGRGNGATTGERVVRRASQLDDREDGMEASHGEGETKAVGVATDAPFDHIRTELTISELG